MIRVLLVDDQQLVRAGLRMLCESAVDIEVTGEAENGQQAVQLTTRHAPDVVLMDLRMPGLDGIGATEHILRVCPESKVVVLTTFDDDDHLYPALDAGACGFLAKDAAPEELLDAIRRAAGGESPFSPAVLHRLIQRAMRHGPGRIDEVKPAELDITDREREVLALVGAGLSNAEVAARLYLGITTVKTHIASLMSKTGRTNRVQLAVLAAHHGLIGEDGP